MNNHNSTGTEWKICLTFILLLCRERIKILCLYWLNNYHIKRQVFLNDNIGHRPLNSTELNVPYSLYRNNFRTRRPKEGCELCLWLMECGCISKIPFYLFLTSLWLSTPTLTEMTRYWSVHVKLSQMNGSSFTALHPYSYWSCTLVALRFLTKLPVMSLNYFELDECKNGTTVFPKT